MEAPTVLHQVLTPPPPQEKRSRPPQPEQALRCPRCESTNTKFCYYNNYSLSQPRYFCKGCRRYWTQGGTLRNVPVGGGCRKNKRTAAAAAVSGNDQQPSKRPHTAPIPSDQDTTFLFAAPNPFNQISTFPPCHLLEILRGGSIENAHQSLYPGEELPWMQPFEEVGQWPPVGGEALELLQQQQPVDGGRDLWSNWHGLINSTLM